MLSSFVSSRGTLYVGRYSKKNQLFIKLLLQNYFAKLNKILYTPIPQYRDNKNAFLCIDIVAALYSGYLKARVPLLPIEKH